MKSIIRMISLIFIMCTCLFSGSCSVMRDELFGTTCEGGYDIVNKLGETYNIEFNESYWRHHIYVNICKDGNKIASFRTDEYEELPDRMLYLFSDKYKYEYYYVASSRIIDTDRYNGEYIVIYNPYDRESVVRSIEELYQLSDHCIRTTIISNMNEDDAGIKFSDAGYSSDRFMKLFRIGDNI